MMTINYVLELFFYLKSLFLIPPNGNSTILTPANDIIFRKLRFCEPVVDSNVGWLRLGQFSYGNIFLYIYI
jgi:hypothetical protein